MIRLTKNLPGAILQVGVGNGEGLITYAQIRDLLCPYSTDKKVIGFDAFEFYPVVDQNEEETLARFSSSDANVFSGVSYEKVAALISDYEQHAPFPQRGVPSIELVVGLVEETIPTFNPAGMRLSLLEVDVNTRSGTEVALEYLFPLLVQGGVCVFGGYAAGPWEGESRAVHEFLQKANLKPMRYEGFLYPSCYVIR
jgi:hypothetical protein